MRWRPVPLNVEELLSPEWLTGSLAKRFPGTEVAKVEAGPVTSRVTTNVRFTIECAGDRPGGLPTALCAKGYFAEESLPLATLGATEAAFYRDLAAATGVRTLAPVYAEVDAQTGRPILITEDVIASGHRFIDATCPYTPDQAAQSLAELARLHAFAWEKPEYIELPWLQPQLPRYLDYRSEQDIRDNFESPLGARVPAEVADPARLIAAFHVLAARAAGPARTVIHGDPHIGNLIIDGAGRPSLVDWQCTQAGDWALDVGYHIASTLAVDDREQHGDDLLAHYLDELRAHGIDARGLDTARREIRRGMVYGFFMWSITLRVDPSLIEILLHRLGTAVAATDGFAALGV
ncbi:phosphotransferase [Streptomyces sp. NPDC002896]|uniref:phosphotransferase n=1 Tax=Streptomyces sp. NPDC002896 TaxID=3154438 RepID=UPI00331A5EB5